MAWACWLSGPGPASLVFALGAALGAASMDGSYTTRATTDVVSGAAGETVAFTRSSASPMDMELGEGTGYSTGTTTIWCCLLTCWLGCNLCPYFFDSGSFTTIRYAGRGAGSLTSY